MKYTKEILEPLVKNSLSIAEVCKKLGKPVNGGTHSFITKRIKDFGINTSHILGQARNRGVPSPRKKHITEYFNSSLVKSHFLKLKLIEYGFKEKKCELCLNENWMGQLIPLELDHIDGNHSNNKLNNLRILCPNCHAQTPTNSGKNRKVKNLMAT